MFWTINTLAKIGNSRTENTSLLNPFCCGGEFEETNLECRERMFLCVCVENYDIIFLNINKIGKDKFIVPPYFGGERRKK